MNKASAVSRYTTVSKGKSGDVNYTPPILADFVADRIAESLGRDPAGRPIRVLDPAVGDGELLLSLSARLVKTPGADIEVHGFDTDPNALDTACIRLKQHFPELKTVLTQGSFIEYVLGDLGSYGSQPPLNNPIPASFDIIIANPPYVRTQIIGAEQARMLADKFKLSGRIDLYYAFILGIARVLKPEGTAGIIVSNRFMTTLSGSSVRRVLLERLNIRHIWDLGDTRLFNAAVLPAVLLAEGKNNRAWPSPAFTSIYQTSEKALSTVANPIIALDKKGIVKVSDGRHFHVRHGRLDTGRAPGGMWRITTDAIDAWLATIQAHSRGTFKDIGKIRVGVKTCADRVFIRSDWFDMPVSSRPELLMALTTHHIARRFKPLAPKRQLHILYPHEIAGGRRCAVDLSIFPRSLAYLEEHRNTLEGRKYVIEAGRKWYEIWVPQNPDVWKMPKLVFRDIADKPIFWIDFDGSVVNGDCYWLTCWNPARIDLLWMAAAIGNSTFIECYYDHCFHNRLYAGRRRFITQYVEKFPMPDPQSPLGTAIIEKARRIYECTPSFPTDQLYEELDTMVWDAFGLKKEQPFKGD